jgi:hypothetical protein
MSIDKDGVRIPSVAMTLGDLRRVLTENADAPDNLPVFVVIPTHFSCADLGPGEDVEVEDHDDYASESVRACVANVLGESHQATLDGYLSPGELEAEGEDPEDWFFCLEISVRPEECHDRLSGCRTRISEEG